MSHSADNSDSKTSQNSKVCRDENFISELFKSIDEVSVTLKTCKYLMIGRLYQLEDFEEKIIVLKAVITEQNKVIQRYSNEVSSVSKRLKVTILGSVEGLFLTFFCFRIS